MEKYTRNTRDRPDPVIPDWISQELDYYVTSLKTVFSFNANNKQKLWNLYKDRFTVRLQHRMDREAAEIEEEYGYPSGYIKDQRRRYKEKMPEHLKRPY